MKHNGGFAEAIHRDAETAVAARTAHKALPDMDALPKCRARERQIREIHARRMFNADRWVNWQVGTIYSRGTEDLV